MILLIGLFIGGLCGFLAATKAGLVSSWVRLLNTAVAVYIAVYVTPSVASSTPMIHEHACGAVLSGLLLFLVTFIILNAICMAIMGDIKVEMHKAFDAIGGGAMGFANGMLVWGFLCLLLWISPLAQSSTVKQICSPDEVEQMWKSSVGTNMVVLDRVSFQKASRALPGVVEMILTEGTPKPKQPKETIEEETEENVEQPVPAEAPEG